MRQFLSLLGLYDVGTTSAMTVVQPSFDRRSTVVKHMCLMLLFLIAGIGNVWGKIADGTYVLCTSTSDLKEGDHYIIASGTSGSVYCISNVSQNNYREIVSATVSNSKITVASNSTIMTFTLGRSNDAWTFYTDNYAGTSGYLASASSGNNNYCRVIASSTTGTISFSSNSSATISLNPHSSRTYLKYNSTNTRFACYSSGQGDVYLYKKASGYSITYNCNGATSDCPSDASGQTALPSTLPTPTKTSCTFAGWYTNSTLTTAAVAGVTLSANANLYAKWTTNVTLNRNGVTETINNVVVGTALDDIDGTDAQGGCSEWTFAGWSKTTRVAQNNSIAMTLATEVDGPGPYYAVYSHTESGGGNSSGHEIISLSDGNFSTDHIDWDATSCVLSQTKGSSSTDVNASYVSAPRVYKGHTLAFVAKTNYTITKIEITVNGSYYGNSMTAGTTISNNIVTNNTTDVGRTWTSTNEGTHEITSVDDDGLSAIYIQNVASSTNTQLRPTEIKVHYIVTGGSTTYYSTTASCCTSLAPIKGSVSWSHF